MLFNSYEFIFGFLPVALAGFLLLGRVSRDLALGWLTLASLVFYGWWRPLNVPIIAVSVLVNFALAELMRRRQDDEEGFGVRARLLTAGIVFNVCFLGYFKYANFALSTVNDVAGTDFVLTQIILPLGISFITFQKIAFLVDVHARRVEAYTFREYMLFVLFFPQLIAGPIVHFREMMPQFRANPCRFDGEGMAVGLTLVCFGLLKKIVLADSIAEYVTPIYELAGAGGAVSLNAAWLAALGFTLQIYFDFSGYSDMAAGLARCFGVRLPLNFWSPLQATSIIDFWSRWHVTLTRFLTAYLYNPLALSLTRRRLAKGLPGLGGRRASVGAFLQLLALPTLVTMFVSGVWHGAGYVFVLWGLLHGIYLVINHAWRITGAKLWSDRESYERAMRPIGFALTFAAVVVAMVLFRSPSVHAAIAVYKGMIGFNGLELPERLAEWLNLPRGFAATNRGSVREFVDSKLWLIALLVIALVMPNTLQIMRRYEPVLGVKERPPTTGLLPLTLDWQPTLRWALVVSVVAALAILDMGGPTEFLYWQF